MKDRRVWVRYRHLIKFCIIYCKCPKVFLFIFCVCIVKLKVVCLILAGWNALMYANSKKLTKLYLDSFFFTLLLEFLKCAP